MYNLPRIGNERNQRAIRVPKVGIIYNDSKPAARRTTQDLKVKFAQMGWQVLAIDGLGGLLGHVHPGEPSTYCPIDSLVPPGFDEAMEFVVVLGGDGTVLSACRLLAPAGIPMLAINTGHMGFITEAYLNALPEAIEQLVEGQYSVEQRTLLTVRLRDRDRTDLSPALDRSKIYWEALCLNEMVLHREPLTSMCHFEIEIGRHAPVDIAADGVILSTPTGSTAYSLSAGGPVVTPDVPVLQLVPMCPHSLASRAMVFTDTETVTIFPANPNPMVMVVDGNAGCAVLPRHRVQIEKSPYSARFIRLEPPEFFRVLREKLGWGLPHIAKPTSVELP